MSKVSTRDRWQTYAILTKSIRGEQLHVTCLFGLMILIPKNKDNINSLLHQENMVFAELFEFQ